MDTMFRNRWLLIGTIFALLCFTFVALGSMHSVQAFCEGIFPIFYGAIYIEIIMFGGISFLLSYFSFKKHRYAHKLS